MKYQNPIIRGFYPDPSICEADGKFYLVCSSFQYFPGVPLFESEDLINWRQIGHVLTRPSQVMLDKVRSSGGVFAPTIRYHEGRFYMVTNNNSTNENFYVYTDDIYGEWSDPVIVHQDGIDPSLLFVDGRAYFVSNGLDDEGKGGVIQCEINIETGEKLTSGKCIWNGSGGRYLESPHVYKIGDYFYLMAAEGGTEYGHMVTYARSRGIWGPYEDYPNNPVLTNRDKAPGIIQAIGHGDLVQNHDGNWYIVTLGFRQIHLWMPFHHLGREVYLTPVSFDENGWFTCGDGTTAEEYEISGDFKQIRKQEYTFENTDWNLDWVYLRKPELSNYELSESKAILHGCPLTLEDVDSPTFLGMRQIDFDMELSFDLKLSGASPAAEGCADSGRNNTPTDAAGQMNVSVDHKKVEDSSIGAAAKEAAIHAREDAGITVYMCENEHYDLLLRPLRSPVTGINDGSAAAQNNVLPSDPAGKGTDGNSYEAVLRLCIGDIKQDYAAAAISGNAATLKIISDSCWYHFYAIDNGSEIFLGKARSNYLSSEVSTGFTGVVLGLFAEGNVTAEFSDYRCVYR